MSFPKGIPRGRAARFLLLWLAFTLALLGGLLCGNAYQHEGPLAAFGTALRRAGEFMTLPAHRLLNFWPGVAGAILMSLLSGLLYAAASFYGANLVQRLRRRFETPQEPIDTQPEHRLSRRSFLTAAAWSAPAAVAAVPLWSSGVAPSRLKLRQYEVAIADLPPELDGLRLAQLSDLHYHRWVSPDQVRQAIQMALAPKPDLLLLTGDYVTSDPSGFHVVARILAEEAPAIPILATLGNHDHWTDPNLARQTLAAVGVTMLDNDRRFFSRAGLAATPAPGSICIGGVGDLWEDAVDFDAAVADAPADCPRVILSHNPDAAEEFSAGSRTGETPPRIDLMLSGHTHGGQVRIPGIGTPIVPSNFGQKYAGGFVQGPHWPVIISRGIGIAVLPVRFLCPPEVVLVTLVRAENQMEASPS